MPVADPKGQPVAGEVAGQDIAVAQGDSDPCVVPDPEPDEVT
jgi:hypothetical protein